MGNHSNEAKEFMNEVNDFVKRGQAAEFNEMLGMIYFTLIQQWLSGYWNDPFTVHGDFSDLPYDKKMMFMQLVHRIGPYRIEQPHPHNLSPAELKVFVQIAVVDPRAFPTLNSLRIAGRGTAWFFNLGLWGLIIFGVIFLLRLIF